MPREDAAQFNGTLSTATYPNRYSAVIPVEAPFYRIGLTLTVTDKTTGTKRKLIEGLDYFLGHYFQELAEAENDAIYGSIMLLNAAEVEYELLSVGRQYRIPASEIGKYLVKTDMKDPRNCDWSELMKYPPIISPIDPPKDLEEAILRDEIVKALEDIRLGILERAHELDEAFAEVTDLIYQNGKQVFDDEMYQHHLIKNAHGYTCGDIGALPVLGKAVDATKAFGRTLAELVTLMSTSGIQQKHVDMLLDNTLGDLLGRMRVLNNDAITFQTTSGHVISMKGEKFIITSTKPLVLKADQDNNEPGLATEFSAGLNTLWVHSGKAGDKWGAYDAGVLAPVYNSVYLVTPDMVKMYLTSVKILPANAYFKSSDTLKIYGSGKETNKVYMNAELPSATTTVQGLFAITNLSASAAASTAISQKAVTDLKNKLDGYVDDTYTVNGKGFVLDANGQMHLTLTASDFGIEKMNNTGPLEKPVTNALRTVLSGKALATHTHTIADVDNVPYASTSVTGLAKLWDAIDTTTDKMVTARQGFLLEQKIDTLNDKIATLLPAWAVGGAQYGNPSFLPIPTVSNFAGFGFNRAQPWGAARYEAGNIYFLRNGTDGPEDTRRVYYWYGAVSSENKIVNSFPTAFPYHPVGMSLFPGVTLARLLSASSDVGLFEGSDGAKYLVLFNGTMNYAKHSAVYKVTIPDLAQAGTGVFTYDGLSSFATITLSKSYVAIIASHIHNEGFRVGGWRLALKNLTLGTDAAFEAIPLAYPTLGGDIAYIVEDGPVEADNPATKRLAYSTAAGRAKWTSQVPVNYRPSLYAAANIDTVRVRAEMHSRVANATAYQWSDAWSVVYNVNVEDGTLVLETPMFPIAFTENVLEWPNGTRLPSVTNRNKGVALYANLFANDDFMINSWCDVYSNNVPNLALTPLGGRSFYELIGGSETLTESHNVQIVGAVGSSYKQYMRGLVHLGGTDRKMLARLLNTSTCVNLRYDLNNKYFPGTEGYGPDNLRTAVDYETYRQVLLSSSIWKNGSMVNNGRLITQPGEYAYKTIAGTTTFTTERITVATSVWDAVEAAIATQFAYWTDPLTIDKQFTVQVYDVGGLNIALLTATVRRWRNETHDYAYCHSMVWKIPMSVNSGALSLGTSGWVVALPQWQDSSAAIGLGIDPTMQSKLAVRTDGYVIQIGHAYRSAVVGDSRWRSFVFTCDTNFANWTMTLRGPNPGVEEIDLFIQPETGYLGWTKWLYLGLYLAADIYQTQSKDFTTATAVETYLAGVKTAEGWNLYITEEELLGFGSTRYTLPTYSADIRDLYPSNYRNRTLYMHAAVVNNTPTYQLLEEQLPDTDTRLYIGYITTDAERITYTMFDRVTRLGAVKQLEEHAAVENKHDMEVGRDAAAGRLAPLRKEAMGPLAIDATKGYLDSQLLYTVSDNQSRGKPMAFKRFEGLKALPMFTQANTSAAFWKNPTTIATVTADENAEAAALGMEWVGVPTPALSPASTNLMVVIQSKFIVPGTTGVETPFNIQIAPWEMVDGFFYNVEAEGTDVNIDENPEVITPVPHTVYRKQHMLPAGVICTFTFVCAVSSSVLEIANQHICSWLTTDAGGMPFLSDRTNCKIQIMPSPGETYGTPVVLNSRSYQFADVAGAIPVVTTGAPGLCPPPVATWSGDDLTLTVAHDWVNERGRQQVDAIQVNLMFRT